MRKGLRGRAGKYYVPLVGTDGNYITTHTFIAGDVKRSLDGGAFANVSNLPTMVNDRAELDLTDAEHDALIVEVKFVDSATKAWLDNTIYIDLRVAGGGFRARTTAFTDDDNFTINWDIARAGVLNGYVIELEDAGDATDVATGIIVASTPNGGAPTTADITIEWQNAPGFTVAVGDYAHVITAIGLANPKGIYTGEATGTPTTTTAPISIGVAFNGQFVGSHIKFLEGPAAGVATKISASALTGGILTFPALPAAPVATDRFVIA